jgi:hypothetical protein
MYLTLGRRPCEQSPCFRPGPFLFAFSGPAGHTRLTMQPQDRERFDRLRALTPIDAVRAWFEGEFGIGDEPAMITAIRRDARISLSEDDIANAICGAMDEDLDARACLERLAGSN